MAAFLKKHPTNNHRCIRAIIQLVTATNLVKLQICDDSNHCGMDIISITKGLSISRLPVIVQVMTS